MKLTNGTDTIELTDEIQIKAYQRAGYTEIQDTPPKKRGAKNGEYKA